MHCIHQCIKIAVLAALPAISHGGTRSVSSKDNCNPDRARADDSDALLQVSRWNIVHASVSASASSETLPYKGVNLSSVLLDAFETQRSNLSSISWVVAADSVLPSVEDLILFEEEKPKVVDPVFREAFKVKLRHSITRHGHIMQRLEPALCFVAVSLVLFILVKFWWAAMQGKLQRRLEMGDEHIYVEYHHKGKWHRAERVVSHETGNVMIRRCSDGMIVHQHDPKHVRKAQPVPILLPKVDPPVIAGAGIVERISDFVSINITHTGAQPVPDASVHHKHHHKEPEEEVDEIAEEKAVSEEGSEEDKEEDLGLAGGASLALYKIGERRKEAKQLVKETGKGIKDIAKKFDKKVDRIGEETKDTFKDAIVDAREALANPTGAIMEGLGALTLGNDVDGPDIASKAVDAVKDATGLAGDVVGAASKAASSVVGKGAKHIQGAHKNYMETFKGNLEKAKKQARKDLEATQQDTVGAISDVVAAADSAKNVAQKAKKDAAKQVNTALDLNKEQEKPG